jgi:DNA-binding protein YbaB
MGFFDQAKNLMKLRKEAGRIKKELKNVHIEATEKHVVVTIDGEQHVVNVKINMEEYAGNKEQLERDLVEAFNKGVKKAQLVAADKMKAIMGDMPPGLMG